MNTYNIETLANIIFELCTYEDNGTFAVDQEYNPPLTAEGVFLKHFMCADEQWVHQGEQDASIYVDGKYVGRYHRFLRKHYKGIPEDIQKMFDGANELRIEDAFGDWKSYRKEDNFFVPVEEHYEYYVRVKGKHFTLYTGVRDDALKALTDGRESVLDVKFHAAFDTALKIAKEKFETR